jgi:hypothetical protein
VTPDAPSGEHGWPARTPRWTSSLDGGAVVVVVGGPDEADVDADDELVAVVDTAAVVEEPEVSTVDG